MRVATVQREGEDVPVVRTSTTEAVPLRALGFDLHSRPASLLAAMADPARREELEHAAERAEPRLELTPATRFRRPFPARAILGIGLNYRNHAEDLRAPLPEEPAYFTKDPRTSVSPGETILLPPESEKVTAEGELALVVGRRCWRVEPDDALAGIAGACAVLDQCAEDVLHRNTRFLTRSKNFPSFLVFGEDLVTLDEATAGTALSETRVATYHNERLGPEAPVADMLFRPAHLVSFLSHVMPLEAGDVICTGTPGAVALADEDTVEARVTGVGSVRATVRRPPPDAYAEEVLHQLEREGAPTLASAG